MSVYQQDSLVSNEIVYGFLDELNNIFYAFASCE